MHHAILNFLMQRTSEGATYLQAIILTAALITIAAFGIRGIARWIRDSKDSGAASHVALEIIAQEIDNVNNRYTDELDTACKLIEVYNTLVREKPVRLVFDGYRESWIIVQAN